MELHHGIDNLHLVNPVVTIGSFDGVHKGHVQVIASLKQVAERLGGETVIISFEPHPREVIYPLEKRPGILTTLEEKRAILERLGVQHLIILPFTRALAELTYTEFVRNLLVDGIAQAVADTGALKIYVSNVMTQEGETEGYTAADHLEALLAHGEPGLVDLCLANTAPVRPGLLEKYREEDAVPLTVDRERVASMGLELVERPVASEEGNYARHDPDKLAQAILEIYRERAVRIFRGDRRYILEG